MSAYDSIFILASFKCNSYYQSASADFASQPRNSITI